MTRRGGRPFQPVRARETVPRIPRSVVEATAPVERAATVVAYLQRAAEATAQGRTATRAYHVAKLREARAWTEEAARLLRIMAPSS